MRTMPQLSGKTETRDRIIARWQVILGNPRSLPGIVTMARQALHNLGADEAERVPGEDDEERAA